MLRWSTVVIEALANGAVQVEALATPEEALARARELGRANVVLGGERGNLAIAGFDLGNSPAEYSRDRVEGRMVITTTTNGTQALVAARHARVVIVAAYRNRSAAARALTAAGPRVSGITLLAAGQAGSPAAEDTACARSVARLLDPGEAMRGGRSDSPDLALGDGLTSAPHARALRAAGFGEDVRFALEGDVSDVVPTLVDGVLVTRVAPGS